MYLFRGMDNMVSTMIKLTSILLLMNIFLYVGMNLAITAEGEDLQENLQFHIEGDLLQELVGTSVQDITSDIKNNFTSYDVSINSNFTTFPELQGGEEIGQGGISFLDAIRISIDFAKLMFNIAVSPLTLFVNYRLPPLLMILIGLPYLVVFIITIMAFLRGVGD